MARGVRPPAPSVLLSRAPPPPPRSLALRRGLRSLRRRLRPGAPPAASAPGVASATRVRGSAVERVRGRRLGGTTGALQADGHGEASGAAVAAPAARATGPQRPLDPTSRYGAGTAAAAPSTGGWERGAARPRGGGGPRAPGAVRRPRPAPDAASREPEAVGSPHPTPVRPQHLSSLQKVCGCSCHSNPHPREREREGISARFSWRQGVPFNPLSASV